jgi:Zn-dependent protease with chaperone function
VASRASSTFFEHQARARQASTRLVVLFLLAVAGVTAAVNAVIATVYVNTIGRYPLPQLDALDNLVITYASLPPALYLWTTALTLAAIAIRSLSVIRRLRAGGDVVATMAGGRLVDRATRDLDARRLLNIVDEMAIASGVTVPRVYLLPGEPGINAFAAGYAPNQAAIAVTEGAMRTLTRDELQGVIGHEFSHVMNGDMRLNVQMIGVLAGILFVGEIGEFLMRSTSGSDRRKGGSGVVLVGLALTIVGYVGLFFGRLIKAALSRQREFLADASSVQFTRNPDGLAGALATIAAIADGSLVRHRRAETLSHMFFASGISVWLASLFATHPPLMERVRRVNPAFVAARYLAGRARARAMQDAGRDGAAQVAGARAPVAAAQVAGAGAAVAGAHAAAGTRRSRTLEGEPVALPPTGEIRGADRGTGRFSGTGPFEPALTPNRPQTTASRSAPAITVVASVGRPGADHVDYAARLLDALPMPVREAVKTAEGAEAVVLAFALSGDETERKDQIEALARAGAEAIGRQADLMAGHVHTLPPAYRLPVVALSAPALRGLSERARQAVVRNVEALVEADRRVTLEEYVLLTVVRQNLRPAGDTPIAHRSILPVLAHARLVVSLLAHAGGGDAQAAFERGFGALRLDARVVLPAGDIAFPRVTEALDELRRLATFVKRTFLTACVETVVADGRIAVPEAELLRAVATALDCPVPPILASLDPAALG